MYTHEGLLAKKGEVSHRSGLSLTPSLLSCAGSEPQNTLVMAKSSA